MSDTHGGLLWCLASELCGIRNHAVKAAARVPQDKHTTQPVVPPCNPVSMFRRIFTVLSNRYQRTRFERVLGDVVLRRVGSRGRL
eukprot:8536410-Pyramimonas_sp.AAC.1